MNIFASITEEKNQLYKLYELYTHARDNANKKAILLEAIVLISS